jgi:hypothetical protein
MNAKRPVREALPQSIFRILGVGIDGQRHENAVWSERESCRAELASQGVADNVDQRTIEVNVVSDLGRVAKSQVVADLTYLYNTAFADGLERSLRLVVNCVRRAASEQGRKEDEEGESVHVRAHYSCQRRAALASWCQLEQAALPHLTRIAASS